MDLKRIVSIDLAFVCSSETQNPWDIADATVDKINAFLAGDGDDPPIGTAHENFNSRDGNLYVNIEIPVSDIDQAKSLETKLNNNLENFPPLFHNQRRFNYWSVPAPVVEEG